MSNVYILVKNHYRNLLGFNTIVHTKDEKEKNKNITVLLAMLISGIVLYVVMCSMIYFYGEALAEIGAVKSIVAMGIGFTSLMTLVATTTKGSSILFLSKDYEIVMPLPIKEKELVGSRFAILYLMNIGMTILMMIPIAVVYGTFASPAISFYVLMVIGVWFIPIIPMLLGTVLSIVVHLIASRFPAKNLVGTILMFVVFIGIFAVSMSAQFVGEEQVIDIGNQMVHMANSIYPIGGLLVAGTCDGAIGSYALFLGLSIVIGVVLVYVVAKTYKKVHTVFMTSNTKGNYQLVVKKSKSPTMALYRRELKRFFSCTAYVFNTAFGAVMLTIASLLLLFGGQDLIGMVIEAPMIVDSISKLVPLLVAGMISSVCTTCVAISLEGNKIGVLKSYPVKPWNILLSKIYVNLTITVPTILFNVTVLVVAFHLNGVETMFAYLLPCLFTFFTAGFGIMVNLFLPSFDWTNETNVIKQSMSSFIGIFSTIILGFLPLFIVFVVGANYALVICAITTIVMVVLNIILYVVLETWGTKRFDHLID